MRDADPHGAGENPYRSPAVASAASAGRSKAKPGGDRSGLAPEWAILLGQAPQYAVLAVIVLLTALGLDFGTLNAAFRLATFESSIFNARVLFYGPGSLRTRVPLVLAGVLSSIFLSGWLRLTGGPSGFADDADVSSIELRLFLAALVGPALGAAVGARDRRRETEEREPPDAILPVAIGIAAGLATAVAGVIVGLRVDPRIVLSFLPQSAAISLVAFLVVQNWRLGVRGVERLASWQSAAFAAGSVVVGVAFATLVQASLSNPNWDDLAALAVLFAFGIVPVARETFLRFAGYRAVNLYVERWRTTK